MFSPIENIKNIINDNEEILFEGYINLEFDSGYGGLGKLFITNNKFIYIPDRYSVSRKEKSTVIIDLMEIDNLKFDNYRNTYKIPNRKRRIEFNLIKLKNQDELLSVINNLNIKLYNV
jgi:hypothetical protein